MPGSALAKEQILEFVETWRTAMATSDVDTAMSLWDFSYPTPVCRVTDYDHALSTFEAIREFYSVQGTAMGQSTWTLSDIMLDVFGELAYVHCSQCVEADVDGTDHHVSYRENVTFVLRKVAGGWKLILFHEAVSPDSSIESLRRYWTILCQDGVDGP